jgi:hypothetical protein
MLGELLGFEVGNSQNFTANFMLRFAAVGGELEVLLEQLD